MSDDKALSYSDEHLFMEWLPELQMLYYAPLGDYDEREAELAIRAFGEFVEALDLGEGYELDFLIDLGSAGPLTFAARKRLDEMLTHPRTGRMAAYNMSSLQRTMLTFMVFAAGRREQLFFAKSKEEATAWLQTKRAAQE